MSKLKDRIGLVLFALVSAGIIGTLSYFYGKMWIESLGLILLLWFVWRQAVKRQKGNEPK